MLLSIAEGQRSVLHDEFVLIRYFLSLLPEGTCLGPRRDQNRQTE
jgi:hypothetical protein